jgi:hypothetical protein
VPFAGLEDRIASGDVRGIKFVQESGVLREARRGQRQRGLRPMFCPLRRRGTGAFCRRLWRGTSRRNALVGRVGKGCCGEVVKASPRRTLKHFSFQSHPMFPVFTGSQIRNVRRRRSGKEILRDARFALRKRKATS